MSLRALFECRHWCELESPVFFVWRWNILRKFKDHFCAGKWKWILWGSCSQCAQAGVSPSAEFSELHRFLSSFDRMHGVCVLRISTTFTMGILLPHAIFQTRTILRAGRGHMSRHVHSRSSYENIVRCHLALKKVTLIMFHHVLLLRGFFLWRDVRGCVWVTHFRRD